MSRGGRKLTRMTRPIRVAGLARPKAGMDEAEKSERIIALVKHYVQTSHDDAIVGLVDMPAPGEVDNDD